jgi:hypothetical protein
MSGSRCERCGFIDWVVAVQCKQCGAPLVSHPNPIYAKMQKNIIPVCIWRGALGGAIGWLLIVIYFAFRNPMDYLAIPYAPVIIFIGMIIGGAIGAVFWVLSIISEINPGMITRALVGMGLVLILGYILFRNESRECVYGVNETGMRYTSSDRRIIDPLVLVLLSGALPGIMARPKKS